MQQLLTLLQNQESELQQVYVRHQAAVVAALLHPEFMEIGRSGLRYDRADVLGDLPEERERVMVSSDFSFNQVADDLVLLHYQSKELQENGGWGKETLRTSLWQRVEGAWLLRFHQGTPKAISESMVRP